MANTTSAADSPLDCDVLLLAAGFGKRLLPLTADKPKPLVLLNGKPLIAYNLELLSKAGVKRVIINLHYLGDQIRSYIGEGRGFGLEVEYSYEPVILDTGGAIKQVEPLLRYEDLLILNSDTIFGPGLNFTDLLEDHRRKASDITAVVREDAAARDYGELGLDSELTLRRFLGRTYSGDGSEELKTYMFSGVQVMRRKVLDRMPPAGSIFSSTRNTWVELLESGGLISGFIFSGYWSDVGTPERLTEASKIASTIF